MQPTPPDMVLELVDADGYHVTFRLWKDGRIAFVPWDHKGQTVWSKLCAQDWAQPCLPILRAAFAELGVHKE